MTPIPLGWSEDPGAVDFIFDGAVLLTSPFWGPCWIAGWLLSLPARAVRRYRGRN